MIVNLKSKKGIIDLALDEASKVGGHNYIGQQSMDY